MICDDVEVKTGLTSRSLALFIQRASRYDAEVFIKKGKLCANAKSFLGLLSLRIENNDGITLTADGLDEKEAIEDLKDYLQS